MRTRLPSGSVAAGGFFFWTDLVIHEGGERKEVKEVCEKFPDVGVAVLPEALVVEAVDLGDLP